MRKTLFVLLSFFCAWQAQALGPSQVTSKVGLGYLLWNEDLLLNQSGFLEFDKSNYKGFLLQTERETLFDQWGWSLGGFVGTGEATAGNNTDLIVYSPSAQRWTLIGLSPRIFYRLSSKINVGASLQLMHKQIDWPTTDPTLSVDGGGQILTAGLLDLNIRLTQNWELSQGVGALSKSNTTLWRLSFNCSL